MGSAQLSLFLPSLPQGLALSRSELERPTSWQVPKAACRPFCCVPSTGMLFPAASAV